MNGRRRKAEEKTSELEDQIEDFSQKNEGKDDK